MSQFEFMRNITIGQYLPTGSWVHRLDPRTRLFTFLLLLFSITIAPHGQGLLLGLCMVILGYGFARIPLRHALRGLLLPLPFLIILALIQIFFFRLPGDEVVLFSWRFLVIRQANLQAAGLLLLRFSGLVLGLGLMTFTLSTNEMVRGLEAFLRPLQKLKLPVQDLVLIVQVTLRFLPLLAQTAERVAKAQAARGADWGGRSYQLLKNVRKLVPILVPIFLISLNRAESLAMAMDVRAYDSYHARTSMVEYQFGFIDLVVILVGIAVPALMLFVL